MRRKLAGEHQGDEEESQKPAAVKPSHQTDRFAYGEVDNEKIAHDLIKHCISKTPSVKVGNGILSIVKVEKAEGEAMMIKVRGEPRYTFDISFRTQFVFQWM